MPSNLDFQFPQSFKEIMDMNVFVGEILSIDYDAETARVEISDIGTFDDVEICYHCEGCSDTTRGSSAFVVGDDVLIVNPGGSCTPSVINPFTKMRIIGFEEAEPRPCRAKFKLRLTRGDGILIDDTLYNANCSILFYDSNLNSQNIEVHEYDAVTGYHMFLIDPTVVSGVPETQFYIYGTYSQDSTSFIWFPNKYQSIYAGNPPASCLRTEGSYAFEFPYWKVEETDTGDVEQIGSTHVKTAKIYSSIPYRLTHYLSGGANRRIHLNYKIDYQLLSLVVGQRCCSSKFAFTRFYIADCNPIDPDATQVIPFGIDDVSEESGWGDSWVDLMVSSSKISHSETYPQVSALDEEETEEITSPSVSGTTHTIQISNDTTSHTVRNMTCGPPGHCAPCCTTGVQSGPYPEYSKAYHQLSFGFKDITYDF